MNSSLATLISCKLTLANTQSHNALQHFHEFNQNRPNKRLTVQQQYNNWENKIIFFQFSQNNVFDVFLLFVPDSFHLFYIVITWTRIYKNLQACHKIFQLLSETFYNWFWECLLKIITPFKYRFTRNFDRGCCIFKGF